MKKSPLLSGIFILLAFSAFAENENDNANAKIKTNPVYLDYSTTAQDNIIIQNRTKNSDRWTIFGNYPQNQEKSAVYNFKLNDVPTILDQNEWFQICTTETMTGRSSSKFMGPWMYDLNVLNHYAIQAESGKNYGYQFETHNNDLFLYIYDETQTIPKAHLELPVGWKVTIGVSLALTALVSTICTYISICGFPAI